MRIEWETFLTIRPVSKVIVSYTRDGGARWKRLATLTPGTSYWDWEIPALARTFSRCRVRIALRDASGGSIGTDTSDGVFSMSP